MDLLKVKNISISFGGLQAVSNFSINLGYRDLVGLIGPNGAGKTTVFNMLTGVYRPQEGEISLEGQPLVNLPPYKFNRLGIARTFQNIRLFNELSVLDNVKIAYQHRGRYSWGQAILRTKAYWRKEREIRDWSMELLTIFNLQDKAEEMAKNLPYGAQRRLEIARALAGKPKLLLLDEPAAGMNPQETLDLMNLIKKIRAEFGLAILLIEHDMNFVMNLCERILVLDYGQTIAEGVPEEIKNNKRVIQAYLGEEVS
ncbi:MAG TPA: ABC transporter ATP-binding protein [Bacillota bacterium]